MRCEVLAIGTELLLGQIVDTNSSWLGEQLALAGIDHYYQSKVGDNAGRIEAALRMALERSDAVVVCGGLGPTHDDITRDVIAKVMGVALERDTRIVEHIRDRFRTRNRPMPDNNLRQADVPVGARTIEQMPGTAPGLVCPVGDRVIYAVPGVPYEMKAMALGTILPDIKRRAGVTATIKSRVLRSWGQSESGLGEQLAGRIAELDSSGAATLAFQASGIEGIKVRITVKAGNDAEALAMLDAEEREVRAILGDIVFAVDGDNMEATVLNMMRERGMTLAVAESLTGGLIGSRLTDIAGASDVFRGSMVAYASQVKFDMLGVPEGPVVSAAAAEAMASGARDRMNADVGISTTGVAGPAEQEGQPAGTVFLGLALPWGTESTMVKLPGDRHRVRQFSVISVLNLLRMRLLHGQPSDAPLSP